MLIFKTSSLVLNICVSDVQVEQFVWQLFGGYTMSGLRGVQICGQGQGVASWGSFVGEGTENFLWYDQGCIVDWSLMKRTWDGSFSVLSFTSTRKIST